MITAADILTTVKQRTGYVSRVREEADIAPTDAQDYLLVGFLRDALTRIAETNRLEGTHRFETVAGVYDYLIPDGIGRIRELWFGGAKLKERDGLEVYNEALSASQGGSPDQWGVYGGRIYLNRAPAGSGEILMHVTYSEGYPVGDSEDILSYLPSEFRRAITLYVLAEWWQLVGMGDLYNVSRTEFEAEMSRKTTDPNRAKTATVPYRYL